MNTSLLSLLFRTYRALPDRFRRRAVVAGLLLVVQSLAELLSLGSIVPAVPILANPAAFLQTARGAKVAAFVGIHSPLTLSALVLAAILVLFVTKNILILFIVRYQTSFVYGLYHDLSARLYRHHMRSGLLALRSRPSTEVARDISGVTNRFAASVVLPYLFLLTEIVVILMLSVGVAFYEPFAFLAVVAILIPPFGLFYLKVKRRIQAITLRINELDALLGNSVYQSIFGYADVISTGASAFFSRRYSNLVKEYAETLGKNALLGLIPARLAEVAMVLGVAVLYFYSTLMIPSLTQRLALFGVFLLSAYRLLPSANRITICLLSIRGNVFSLDVAEAALAMPDQDEDPVLPQPLPFRDAMTFENVCFRYTDTSGLVLDGLNLVIRKGECLGIAGGSGTGKSTFLNLLLGLFEPTGGEIRVDGLRLAPENLDSWRQHVGYVQQEIFLLDETIRENIAFGVDPARVDATRIARAVELSALGDLVAALPKGLSTPVGERGAALSVGQKQRIGIARALYHGADVIVFDEPTSALDPETEREITESIKKLREAGCTVILVSHRESSLRICDRVIKLEQKTFTTSSIP